MQKMLPYKVASLVVLLKDMMMANAVATWVGVVVRLDVVVAGECKRTGRPVRGVCGKGPMLGHFNGFHANGFLR